MARCLLIPAGELSRSRGVFSRSRRSRPSRSATSTPLPTLSFPPPSAFLRLLLRPLPPHNPRNCTSSPRCLKKLWLRSGLTLTLFCSTVLTDGRSPRVQSLPQLFVARRAIAFFDFLTAHTQRGSLCVEKEVKQGSFPDFFGTGSELFWRPRNRIRLIHSIDCATRPVDGWTPTRG